MLKEMNAGALQEIPTKSEDVTTATYSDDTALLAVEREPSIFTKK